MSVQINIPIIVNTLLFLDLQISMCSSGYINIFSVELGMFLVLAHGFEPGVHSDGDR